MWNASGGRGRVTPETKPNRDSPCGTGPGPARLRTTSGLVEQVAQGLQ